MIPITVSCDDPSNWITKHGYTRNLCLEEKLERDYATLTWKDLNDRVYLPPHWLDQPLGWRFDNKTDQQAINYLEDSYRILKIRVDKWQYAGEYYPRDPAPAEAASQWGSELSKIERLMSHIRSIMQAEKIPSPAIPTDDPVEETPPPESIELETESKITTFPLIIAGVIAIIVVILLLKRRRA